jgi:GntR family transcriptional regulator
VADPKYKRIADDLRDKIETGRLHPGGQLPTELDLMSEYGSSRNTVRDAIKWLITRSLVETRPGQGTFVVEKISPFVTTLTDDPETGLGGGEGKTYVKEVTARFRQQESSLPRVEIQAADEQLVTELQLEAGSSVVSRHQQRFIDNTPWSLQTSFYPMSLIEKGAVRLLQAGDIEEGTVVYLRDKLDIKQMGYRDLVTVRAPDNTEIGFFKLPDDGRVSVIETRRTAFGEGGSPFRLTVSVYPADRNQFAINVGKVPATVAEPVASTESAAATPDDATLERSG